jgi:hypothetical protein
MKKLRCVQCDKTIEAGCDCGVSYVPVSERAAAAVKKSPDKSNRMIAADTGLSKDTVRRARKKAVGASAPTEKRTGKDGKSYKAAKSAKIIPSPGVNGFSAEVVDIEPDWAGPAVGNLFVLAGTAVRPADCVAHCQGDKDSLAALLKRAEKVRGFCNELISLLQSSAPSTYQGARQGFSPIPCDRLALPAAPTSSYVA